MASLQERRNKDGILISFSIRVHRGRGADGRQLKPYTTTFEVQPTWSEKTARKKAETFAANFERDCKNGIAADTKQTFEKYARYCISLKKERGAKRTTIDVYTRAIDRIAPIIGGLKVADIRPDTINKLYTNLAENASNQLTGEELSGQTLALYHRVLHGIFRQAVQEGLIPFNPCDRVQPPKVSKKDPNYFSADEVSTILNAADSEPLMWRTMVNVMAFSGCRRGEILGLTWRNCDFVNNRIYIDRNVIYLSGEGVYVDSPKTQTSCRFVAMPPIVMKLLQDYHAEQKQFISSVGSAFIYQDFVFTQRNGSPLNPHQVSTWLKNFGVRHNLPHINAHAFRHSVASAMIYNGVDPVSVSHRLGHSSAVTTLTIYAHEIADMQSTHAEMLADIFSSKTAKNEVS